MPLGRVRQLEFVGFLLFFGLRGYVMSDATQYYNAFQGESDFYDWGYGFQLDTYSFEPGFRLFEKIVRAFTDNYFIFQFINSLVDIILLDIIFRKNVKYYSLGFLIFFMIEGWMYEMNALRNMKSILIFFISLPYIQDKNLIKYLFLNFIGASFHLSSVFYIPLYWILNRRFPKAFILTIIVAGILIPMLNIRVFQLLHLDSLLSTLRFSNYFASSDETYKVGFRLLERSFICILIYKCYSISFARNIKIFFNLYLLYFMAFNILYEIPIFPIRVAGLFLPAAWIVVPFLISEYKKYNVSRVISFVFLYGMLILGYSTVQDTQQYRNILFSNETYEEYVLRYENAVDKLK